MKTKNIIILCTVVFIVGLFSSYLILDYNGSIVRDKSETLSENSSCEVVTQDQARLHIETIGMFENIDDSSEMFFDYWIYNFGGKEAKNVKVKCRIYDEKDKVVSETLDNFGNIASNSAEFGEVVTEQTYDIFSNEVYGACYVESCDNCEILYKKIPELKNSYEGN